MPQEGVWQRMCLISMEHRQVSGVIAAPVGSLVSGRQGLNRNFPVALVIILFSSENRLKNLPQLAVFLSVCLEMVFIRRLTLLWSLKYLFLLKIPLCRSGTMRGLKVVFSCFSTKRLQC